ncbi:MAG TPA: Rne/Rng family ribonuclease [Nocardioides sp.]|nr:Rne/Rng family ribonuclease [Nocardioides sp.]
MNDDAPINTTSDEQAPAAPASEAPAQPPAAEAPPEQAPEQASEQKPDEKPAKKTAAKKAPAKKAAAKKAAAKKAPAKKTAAKKAAAKAEPRSEQLELAPEAAVDPAAAEALVDPAATEAPESTESSEASGTAVLFQAPPKARAPRKRAAPKPKPETEPTAASPAEDEDEEAGEATEATEIDPAAPVAPEQPAADKSDKPDETGKAADTAESADEDEDDDAEDDEDEDGASASGQARRRRRRGGRRRRKPAGQGGNAQGEDDSDDESGDAEATDDQAKGQDAEGDDAEDSDDNEGSQGEGGGSSSSRRRRRRRRAGEGGGSGSGDDDEPNTVTRVRKPRSAEDEITSVQGSTRLEAKKQRRREGREAGRRRAPIVSEAEFLARRESVERVMAIRQRKDLTQIAVLEDKVLVEHYVARETQTSLIGNVYLGRVQNVLPSMEAAFIDIGKGRNAVLYAGEVNWQALGHKDGEPRKIESVLQSGQPILVQVSKDPIGHKGARLTSQVSLAGRFLVYVPDGTTSGISRKLPDTERARLKTLLKEIVPESAGVIVRTAAEGASEDELTRDVERLKARWEDIEAKVAKGNAPQLLYGEPDLTLKVVRDLFTEDFAKLVIQGDEAWTTVKDYVDHVAPDLSDRVEHFEAGDGGDIFATYRIDEQIAKGVDRKVWLPSGGSLVIDRTEAMTVIDVNTGKFTGSGGNLEETVTKNNLEAAEEIVRQLRLRDIGGIIVVDFIDMVLESNRDLVLRRLVECLGRDRTRHQVAEVTSLGLVQMTRKRIGTGLLEAFSENCPHCQGRGIVVHDMPVEPKRGGGDADGEPRRGNRRKGKGKGDDNGNNGNGNSGNGGNGNSGGGPSKAVPSPKDVAAMAKQHEEEAAAAAAAEAAGEPESTPAPDAAPQPDPAPVTEVAAEPQVAPEPEVAPESEVTPEPEVAPEQPVAAEPKATTTVVTRTRRRAASRPAGPPAGATAEPEAPVTGAPAPAADGSAADSTDSSPDSTGGEEPHVEHVPVKKKGTRKR